MTANGFAKKGRGAYALSGSMTFQTVPQFLAHTNEWLREDGAVTLDMGNVDLADSAGLALMLEWLQTARAAKRELVFANIPEQVSDLIRVNGLTRVFGIKNGQD